MRFFASFRSGPLALPNQTYLPPGNQRWNPVDNVVGLAAGMADELGLFKTKRAEAGRAGQLGSH